MPKLNSTGTTFILAAGFAAVVLSTLDWTSSPNGMTDGVVIKMHEAHAQSSDGVAPPKRKWAASATGRVEPKSDNVNISAETAGRIVAVPVETGALVKAGHVLVQLDDEDALHRVVATVAEVDVRKLERKEEAVTGIALERYKAQDVLGEAQRSLFAAWRSLDAALEAKRDGSGDDAALDKAHAAVTSAKDKIKTARSELAKVVAKPDAPLPNRLETSLEISRVELAMAEHAFERTRIRAPFDGTVLRTMASVGEIAAPSPQSPLLQFGDISTLRVRAEVEERDVGKVRVGQKVIVRADAFPDREFEGTVTLISSALGRPRIASRGPRRPNDVDVLEVLAVIDGTPPLLTGMRVDVFFKIDDKKTSQSTAERQ